MISNLTRGTVLAARVHRAEDPVARLLGLMGRASLPVGEALLFPGTKGVHTCFMRFAIDVVFYDRAGVVVEICDTLRPWRASAITWSATGAIELPAGTARETETHVGDRLLIPPSDTTG